jgi:hypothetical protein
MVGYLKAYYVFQKNTSLVIVLGQMNPIHTLPFSFFKNFIIFQSIPMFSNISDFPF